MHYLKRLVTVFSLGALFTMETTFNATPPANALEPIRDDDCALHALRGAAGLTLAQVAERTGLMQGPAYNADAITRALPRVGLGNVAPVTFATREDLDRYLRSHGDREYAEYIVGWQRNGSRMGHVINARVSYGRIQFIDNQQQCLGSAAEPPRDRAYAYTYTAWRTRRRQVMDGLTFLFGNLTLDGLMKRNESFGNFTASCKKIALFTNVDRSNSVNLSAECPDNQGKFTPTAIDINTSIINSFGALMWQKNGGFGASVRNCKIQVGTYTVLLCDAADGKGSWRKAAINLDTEIVNKNGKLTVLHGF
jgi:hypothetical protein